MTNDTTPAPIGADARSRFIRWYMAYLHTDEMLAAHVWDSDHITAQAWRAALASAAQPAADDITPSEAVFAFAAWLTCRDEAVTLGSAHDAAGAEDLAGAFVASQGLAQPRDDFHRRLRPYPAAAPKAAPAQPDAAYAEPLHITHGPLMRHAAYLLRSRKPVWPEHESVAEELELAADGHPTPAGEPSSEWLEVVEAAMRAAAPTTQAAPAKPKGGDCHG